MNQTTTDQKESRVLANQTLTNQDKAELKAQLSQEYHELMDIRLLLNPTLIRTKIDLITALIATLGQSGALVKMPVKKAALMASMEQALRGEGDYQAFGTLKNQVDRNVRTILPVWR